MKKAVVIFTMLCLLTVSASAAYIPVSYTHLLCIQDPDLEGFRMGGDGQPLFYLTARSDDREDSAADAVSAVSYTHLEGTS